MLNGNADPMADENLKDRIRNLKQGIAAQERAVQITVRGTAMHKQATKAISDLKLCLFDAIASSNDMLVPSSGDDVLVPSPSGIRFPSSADTLASPTDGSTGDMIGEDFEFDGGCFAIEQDEPSAAIERRITALKKRIIKLRKREEELECLRLKQCDITDALDRQMQVVMDDDRDDASLAARQSAAERAEQRINRQMDALENELWSLEIELIKLDRHYYHETEHYELARHSRPVRLPDDGTSETDI